MKNISDTEAYTVYDHVFSGTARALSRVIGLKRITQPFWARWLASGVDEDTLFSFLDGVGTIDDWASTASKVVDRKVAEYEARKEAGGLSQQENVEALRRLSYLCHMAQWGCLPLNDTRRKHYRMARDYYVAAETLAFADRFRRIGIPWKGHTLFGHLHLQKSPAPLVVIVHGIDGCKEEHLATELSLHEYGFNTLGFDGPGQGEGLLLDGVLWDANFQQAISTALDAAQSAAGEVITTIGGLGISVGGLWMMQCAAHDQRIKAVFDLGGLLTTDRFASLPFLIKTRVCQMTGTKSQAEIERILRPNTIREPGLLDKFNAAIRIVHGSRDRIVLLEEKQWLLEELLRRDPSRNASLRLIEGGDHCCTAHAQIVRQDAVDFFKKAF
jgi:dienelactone hydrolase